MAIQTPGTQDTQTFAWRLSALCASAKGPPQAAQQSHGSQCPTTPPDSFIPRQLSSPGPSLAVPMSMPSTTLQFTTASVAIIPPSVSPATSPPTPGLQPMVTCWSPFVHAVPLVG